MSAKDFIDVYFSSKGGKSYFFLKITHVRLNLKLNCQVDGVGGGGGFPSSSQNDKPTWISFNRSTLHRNNWYW